MLTCCAHNVFDAKYDKTQEVTLKKNNPFSTHGYFCHPVSVCKHCDCASCAGETTESEKRAFNRSQRIVYELESHKFQL